MIGAMAWILDLDGVVWRGDQPIAGSAEAIARLRASGEEVGFVTNFSYAPVEAVEAKLAGFGIEARWRGVDLGAGGRRAARTGGAGAARRRSRRASGAGAARRRGGGRRRCGRRGGRLAPRVHLRPHGRPRCAPSATAPA